MSGDNHNQADQTWRAYYPGTLSDAHLIVKVIEEHPMRGMHCLCGAAIGDTVDRVWHLANQVAEVLRITGRIRGEVAS